MEFYENLKVKPESLTWDEAQEFDYWLRDEYRRHIRCIVVSYDQKDKSPLIKPILEGAIKRHRKELESTVETRRILKELFGL